MTGIAQKLFFERSAKSLSGEAKKASTWPFLEEMLNKKCLGFVDYAIAEHLLIMGDDESLATLICHLSMAARRGHVCVKIHNEKIQPSPEDIWVVDDPESSGDITALEYAQLSSLIFKGCKEIKFPLISLGSEVNSAILTPVVKNQDFFYLHRFWHFETLFLKTIQQKLSDKQSLIPLDQDKVVNRIDMLLSENKLLKEQAEAILIATQSPLTLITGGPGTGKTYTAGLLLRTIWEALDKESKSEFKISLTAPTGKAAANLQASIQNALSGEDGFPQLKAQTLHQLLGIKKHMRDQHPLFLTADLILVDESSMIDIRLMGQLFSAIKPGARLIMLGDRHQLPSIEAGSLFTDLINFFAHKQSSVVELKTCLRAELKSIIDLADQIKLGNDEHVLSLLESDQEGIKLVKLEQEMSVNEQQKRLLGYAIPQFPLVRTFPEDPSDLLKQFSRFRILSPMRKGALGVDALNVLIYQAMLVKAQGGCFIAPIMVTKNDYDLALFNGEVGLILKERDQEFALFASRELGAGFRQIPLLLMPSFEYAYCLSVHKSQGSEFEHVALILPEGTQTFGREALYTGVTRAKRSLEVWSQPLILSQMIKLTSVRQSGVVERLSSQDFIVSSL